MRVSMMHARGLSEPMARHVALMLATPPFGPANTGPGTVIVLSWLGGRGAGPGSGSSGVPGGGMSGGGGSGVSGFGGISPDGENPAM